MKKKKEVILAFGAHNDDHTLGAGGTLTKYAKEGAEVVVFIFSYGEGSHAWLKPNETIKMRVTESKRSDKYLGISKTYYYGLKEGQFPKEIEQRGLKKKIKRIINVLRPTKIFTHSFDDPHPDHRAVHKTVTECMDEIKYECDVYSYDIWNPFNFRKRDSPKMVVDITDTFQKKINSFNLHKSQWMTKIIMIPATYARALLNGLDRGYKYAEVFFKLR